MPVPPTPEQQRRARIFGVLFAGTFVTAIAALILYDPVLNDADYVLGDGSETRVRLGAYLEVFLVITNIGTAVVLWPILKRQSETLALGYVASRVVEGTVIAVGLISLLSVVTLREDLAGGGADAGALGIAGESLVAIHDGTFLLGPGFCVAVGNGMILGYLMYRSGLMPRQLAMLGLIGGPLVFASSTAVLFGTYEQSDGEHFLLSIPEILWEASLGIYLLVKGFKASPILDDSRYTGLDEGFRRPAGAAP
jgi:Domain of unknown function (DUF4386)